MDGLREQQTFEKNFALWYQFLQIDTGDKKPVEGRALHGCVTAAGQANCSSSVEPVSAVTDDLPAWTTWVTSSK